MASKVKIRLSILLILFLLALIVKYNTDFLPINEGSNTIKQKFERFSFVANNHNRGGKFTPLPSFTNDLSDLLVGSIIERTANSYDLYVTAFFWCHWMTTSTGSESSDTISFLNPRYTKDWKRFILNSQRAKDDYFESGERKQLPAIRCRITHAEGYEPYTVDGRFIPNRLGVDSNANRRLDIFRCKMRDPKAAYTALANTSAIMTVEILKGNLTIIAYQIPWKTRTSGYLLEWEPAVTSRFDPWKGYDPRVHPSDWTQDRLYMAVPGLDYLPDRYHLAQTLEFVQHHLLMGVQHIFLVTSIGNDTEDMRLLLRVLRSFIDDGTVTLISGGQDGQYIMCGSAW